MQKLSVFFLIGSFSLQAQIKFDSLSWNDALQRAKTSNKLIFMHAAANWCEPCEEMAEYVFSDLEAGNFYNREFINIQMDMERYPGMELAEKYAVGVYPSFLFVNQYGEVVHRGCGAMESADFLLMGEAALDENRNLISYQKKYGRGDRSTDLLMNYLELMESACLDAERFAADYLRTLKEEELVSETAWAVFASYNWDIYSREFQYLLNHQNMFDSIAGPSVVQSKIYDTFLSQYQEVYEAEELHDFGMRSLLHAINQTSFQGSDTLVAMMNLHYAEYVEDWEAYASSAITYVTITALDDPEALSELAWQFYLFVDNKTQLAIATGWAEQAVEQLPDPSIIDTYASLQFKLGNKKKAIELEEKALELAEEVYDDTTHFQYQLKRFKGND